jgi:hypothetical protein
LKRGTTQGITPVDDISVSESESRRLGPDDVLAVLVEMHRQSSAVGESDPDAEIRFDTTIAEWREACDLLAARELGSGYNKYFGTGFSDEEWLRVLEPEDVRTLRDVCELVATQAAAPRREEMCVLGQACPAAGLFLTIRRELEAAEWDVTDLSPSSPLEPYLHGPHSLVAILARLAPGKIPRVALQYGRTNTVVGRIFAWLAVVGLLGTVLVMIGFGVASLFRFEHSGNLYFVSLAATALLVMVSIVGLGAIDRLHPPRILLGELTTFRDLCRSIAAEESRLKNADSTETTSGN